MRGKSSVIQGQILNREENHVIDLNWGDIMYQNTDKPALATASIKQ